MPLTFDNRVVPSGRGRLVAFSGITPVGYADYEIVGDGTVRVNMLRIEPAFRCLGYGRQLTDQLVTTLTNYIDFTDYEFVGDEFHTGNLIGTQVTTFGEAFLKWISLDHLDPDAPDYATKAADGRTARNTYGCFVYSDGASFVHDFTDPFTVGGGMIQVRGSGASAGPLEDHLAVYGPVMVWSADSLDGPDLIPSQYYQPDNIILRHQPAVGDDIGDASAAGYKLIGFGEFPGTYEYAAIQYYHILSPGSSAGASTVPFSLNEVWKYAYISDAIFNEGATGVDDQADMVVVPGNTFALELSRVAYMWDMRYSNTGSVTTPVKPLGVKEDFQISQAAGRVYSVDGFDSVLRNSEELTEKRAYRLETLFNNQTMTGAYMEMRARNLWDNTIRDLEPWCWWGLGWYDHNYYTINEETFDLSLNRRLGKVEDVSQGPLTLQPALQGVADELCWKRDGGQNGNLRNQVLSTHPDLDGQYQWNNLFGAADRPWCFGFLAKVPSSATSDPITIVGETDTEAPLGYQFTGIIVSANLDTDETLGITLNSNEDPVDREYLEVANGWPRDDQWHLYMFQYQEDIPGEGQPEKLSIWIDGVEAATINPNNTLDKHNWLALSSGNPRQLQLVWNGPRNDDETPEHPDFYYDEYLFFDRTLTEDEHELIALRAGV